MGSKGNPNILDFSQGEKYSNGRKLKGDKFQLSKSPSCLTVKVSSRLLSASQLGIRDCCDQARYSSR